MLKKMIFGAVAAAIAGSAMADGVYVGALMNEHDIDEYSPGTFMGRLGYELLRSEWGNGTGWRFGVEGRYGFDTTASSVSNAARESSVRVNDLYGIYARGGWSTGIVTPYLMLGFSEAKLRYESIAADGSRVNADVDDSGFSWGLGVDYDITPQYAVGVEYMSYLGSDVDLIGDGLQAFALTAKAVF
ncbi:outer membrane beta-barrel protein [Gammaproteobacteria bacterium]|nr:outer membrane beta-barrel protein [Gammaproteobacteria bacterium]